MQRMNKHGQCLIKYLKALIKSKNKKNFKMKANLSEKRLIKKYVKRMKMN